MGILVVASLMATSLADLPRGARPAGAAPAVDERPSVAEFGAVRPAEPKVVRVTAPPRTRSTPAPPAAVPGAAMIAYERAADAVSCGLHWSVLAAIGRVESNHGRFGGTRVLGDGTVTPAIRGIQLDGRAGIATIRDTDGGRLDGDAEYDRAIGPMQFIPSTWARYAADGNDDGVADPDNLYDATLVAARYLCAGGDVSGPAQLSAAVFRYNRSQTYVDMVLMLAAYYRNARLITDLPVDDLPMPAPPMPAPPAVGTPAPPPAPSPVTETASVTPPPTPQACPSTEDTPVTTATPEPLLPLVDEILDDLTGDVTGTAEATQETPCE